ncbi:MAG: PEP-CTERM sorting domain-containing protein [Armatimonadota bacterium]
MTVRNLLGGATLAAAATMLAASGASAQEYTYSVNSPTVSQVMATIGSTNVITTGVATTAPLIGDGFVGLTPFFNYNRNNDTSAGSAAGSTTLTVTAFRNGVAATNTQTLVYTNTFTSNTAGTGGVTLSGFSANFSTASFLFNFAAGGGFGASTVTLSNFGFSNATGVAGASNSTDGVVGFQNITVNPPRQTAAPEPGSLALAATGLMGAMGMVIRRRRSAK